MRNELQDFRTTTLVELPSVAEPSTPLFDSFNRDKHQRLSRFQELLGAAVVTVDESPSSQTTAEWMLSLRIDITRCPCCVDVLHRDVVLPKSTNTTVCEH